MESWQLRLISTSERTQSECSFLLVRIAMQDFTFAKPSWVLSRDQTWIKALVAFLIVLETFNAAFCIMFIYTALILNFSESRKGDSPTSLLI